MTSWRRPTRRYLPATRARPARIVLAASRGSGLGEATADRPKCMVDVRGKPLLRRLLGHAGRRRHRRRHRGARLPQGGDRRRRHHAWSTTTTTPTPAKPLRWPAPSPRLQGETVVVYGDVLFRRYILDGLLDSRGRHHGRGRRSRAGDAANPRDLVAADRPHHRRLPRRASRPLLTGVASDAGRGGRRVDRPDAAHRARRRAAARRAGGDAAGRHARRRPTCRPLLQRLAARHPVAVHYITGHWLDVDTLADLAEARNFS